VFVKEGGMLLVSYLKPKNTTVRMCVCVRERERQIVGEREREIKNRINNTYSVGMFVFVCVGANIQSV
jgi:hypothetical protein